MDTLVMIILGALVLAYVFRTAPPAQPTVIYIQPEPEVSSGVGCLPFILLGIALVFVLLLTA